MSQVMQAPKLLQAGEGEAFQMLSHTFTSKVSADDTNGAWVMFEITDTAGNGAPLHTHPWEETFYILDGELEVVIGNRKVKATKGASLHLPANTVHSFTICSPTVRFLVMLPAYAEPFYREVSDKVALPPRLEDLQAVCQNHGVRLV